MIFLITYNNYNIICLTYLFHKPFPIQPNSTAAADSTTFKHYKSFKCYKIQFVGVHLVQRQQY